MRSTETSTLSTPVDVWLYYIQYVEALEAYKATVMERAIRGEESSPIFRDWTVDKIRKNFERLNDELICWAILNFIATTEAIVRRDYLRRVRENKKQPLSRIYKELYRNKGKAVRLKDDLLLNWPKVTPSCKTVVNRFISEILPIRNWIAHGRYYKFQPKTMNVETIRTRIEELLNCGIIAN
jgi:hypothetical protein